MLDIEGVDYSPASDTRIQAGASPASFLDQIHPSDGQRLRCKGRETYSGEDVTGRVEHAIQLNMMLVVPMGAVDRGGRY